MELLLKPEMFINNKYFISYGNREAVFTIVDEEFAGLNNLGRINRITVLIRTLDSQKKEMGARLSIPVIGVGDGFVGAHSENAELRGKVLTKNNIEQCVITLYED